MNIDMYAWTHYAIKIIIIISNFVVRQDFDMFNLQHYKHGL